MELRIQILSIAVSAALLLVVLEMVRRKAFLERYALLWLLSALVMLALSIWGGALESLAKLIGIAYPPNALFLVAFGFVLLLLLHFSLAVSKLSDQTKILAQRLALVEQQQQQRRQGEQRPQASAEFERELESVASGAEAGRTTQR
jgi:hypothetical protein